MRITLTKTLQLRKDQEYARKEHGEMTQKRAKKVRYCESCLAALVQVRDPVPVSPKSNQVPKKKISRRSILGSEGMTQSDCSLNAS